MLTKEEIGRLRQGSKVRMGEHVGTVTDASHARSGVVYVDFGKAGHGRPYRAQASWLTLAKERDARRRRDPSAEIDLDAFNARLAKLVTGLKKDAGAETIRQNYKGTGSRKHRRQLWIHFKSGAVIDLWLDSGFAQLGGVVTHGAVPGAPPLSVKRISYAGKTPEEVYREIASVLGPWANPEAARDRDRGWYRHPRLHRRAAKLGLARHPRKRRAMSRDPRRVTGSKKGDVVAFEYRGFRVVGRVRRVLKDGTRTVEITEASPGFERHMAQTIDEGIMVDVRHE